MKPLPIDRTAVLSLAPRPNSTSIARVLVLERNAEMAKVLDIDLLSKAPRALDEIATGYSFALRLWDWLAAAIFWGSIAASVFWNWWAFLPGFLIAFFIWRMNRKSLTQYAAGAMLAFPDRALGVFAAHGMIWTVNAGKIQQDTT